jgi:hypothetical protein
MKSSFPTRKSRSREKNLCAKCHKVRAIDAAVVAIEAAVVAAGKMPLQRK